MLLVVLPVPIKGGGVPVGVGICGVIFGEEVNSCVAPGPRGGGGGGSCQFHTVLPIKFYRRWPLLVYLSFNTIDMP